MTANKGGAGLPLMIRKVANQAGALASVTAQWGRTAPGERARLAKLKPAEAAKLLVQRNGAFLEAELVADNERIRREADADIAALVGHETNAHERRVSEYERELTGELVDETADDDESNDSARDTK